MKYYHIFPPSELRSHSIFLSVFFLMCSLNFTHNCVMHQMIILFYISGSLLSRKSLCTCIMVWQISTKITEDMWSHEAKPNFWVKLIQKQLEVIMKVKFQKFDANWCINLHQTARLEHCSLTFRVFCYFVFLQWMVPAWKDWNCQNCWLRFEISIRK